MQVTIIVGIILYKSCLDIFKKNIQMFSRQMFSGKNVKLKFIILDNDNGCQLEQLKNNINVLTEKIEVHLLPSDNVGFAGGHNKIFKFSMQNFNFDYYLAANPDGFPDVDMVDNLLMFAEKTGNNGIYEARQFPCEHPKFYDEFTGITDWVSGCCSMFPKNIYSELGGYDETFFMYCEDVDISWRARLSGYNCYTVNDAYFCHYVESEERDNNFVQKNMMISGCILAKKFNNKVFLSKCLKDLDKILSCDEKIGLIKKLQSVNIIKKFGNFKNGYYFTRARW